VTPQAVRSGNTITFTPNIAGIQAGKTAKLHIWLSDNLFLQNAGMLLAPPPGCTFDASASLQLAFVCNLTASTSLADFDVTRAMSADKGTVTFFIEAITTVDSNSNNNTVAIKLADL